jgi:hypothetical protein
MKGAGEKCYNFIKLLTKYFLSVKLCIKYAVKVAGLIYDFSDVWFSSKRMKAFKVFKGSKQSLLDGFLPSPSHLCSRNIFVLKYYCWSFLVVRQLKV